MRVHKLTQALNHLSVQADTATYASLLRQCGNAKALIEGKQVHAHLRKNGYEGDTYIGNLLVQMYGSCRSVENARAAFEALPHRNVFSWNIMFAAYAQNGHLHDAKGMFDVMPEWDTVSWNAMLGVYSEHGYLEEARHAFEQMPERDVVSWTALISALAQNGKLEEARSMFNQMEQPNVVTWNVMIQAYAQRGDLQEASTMINKMPRPDVVSWTAMISACAFHGHLHEARSIFDTMLDRNLVTWNAMLQAYTLHGQLEEARSLFDEMPYKNVVSWTAMVGAYAEKGCLQNASGIFELMPEQDLPSWNAMVAAYAEIGHLERARLMFNQAPERNVVTWTAMIKAYALSGYGRDALQLFRIMDIEGMKPDEVTYVSIVDACASLAALTEGRIIHANIVEDGFHNNFIVGTSLINMYGNCGRLEDAQTIFEGMAQRNEFTWNAMVLAYAQNGHARCSLELFLWMQLDGIQPDEITFVTILFACSHAGFLKDGRHYFLSISQDYNLIPTVDHYVCMIDVLARAGRLDEARNLISNMPFEPDDMAWTTLLSACRSHGIVGEGVQAGELVFQFNSNKAAAPLHSFG